MTGRTGNQTLEEAVRKEGGTATEELGCFRALAMHTDVNSPSAAVAEVESTGRSTSDPLSKQRQNSNPKLN